MPDELQRADDFIAQNYQSMLVSFDVVTGPTNIRKSAVPTIQRLPELMPEGERLLAFVQARMATPKAKVVLAATTSRLIALRDGDGQVMLDIAREGLSAAFQTDFMWGTRLDVTSSDSEATFKQLLPGPQGDRIFALVGGSDPRPNRLDLLTSGQPEDPGHPPLAALWQLAVYRDRMIDHEGRHLPFTGGPVQATCDSAGNIAVTRGRNLAAKGVGTVFLGPIGLFGMGNAKERQTDTRELYLLVEGPGWAYTQQFQPDLGGPLREFALNINQVAQTHFQSDSSADSEPGDSRDSDPAKRLRELASLRDEGIITDEEFAEHKERMLGEM